MWTGQDRGTGKHGQVRIGGQVKWTGQDRGTGQCGQVRGEKHHRTTPKSSLKVIQDMLRHFLEEYNRASLLLFYSQCHVWIATGKRPHHNKACYLLANHKLYTNAILSLKLNKF